MWPNRQRPDPVSPGGIEMHEAHYPGRAPIDSFGSGGFRFADMSHRGSLLCLPSGIHGWEPKDPANITPDDLQRVLDEAGHIRILLAGLGPHFARLPAATTTALREAGIVTDPMSTPAAVRTYNVLVAEDRPVAALLLAV